jgi:hypothetical protein
MDFLRVIIIRSTTSFGGEVKPSVRCRRFTACKRTLRAWIELVLLVSKIQSGHFSPDCLPDGSGSLIRIEQKTCAVSELVTHYRMHTYRLGKPSGWNPKKEEGFGPPRALTPWNKKNCLLNFVHRLDKILKFKITTFRNLVLLPSSDEGSGDTYWDGSLRPS